MLQIFDPPMCCATGLCGPEVAPGLVAFATDLEWLKSQGVLVRRHNLAQNPEAIVENELVRISLTEKGESALPLVLVDRKLAVTGRYPTRIELANLLGLRAPAAPATKPPGACGCGNAGS